MIAIAKASDTERAPGWYRITKDVIRSGNATHLKIGRAHV